MKKFIITFIFYLFYTAVFYVLVLIIWGMVVPDNFKKNLNYKIGAPGYTYTRLEDAKKSSPVDILFLGSSHAYRGFDTRIFKEYGYNSFNLGSSSQTPIQTEALLSRYLNRLKPATVVFEVYPYIFSSDGVESSIDIIANSPIDFNAFKMSLNLNHVKTYNSILYSSFRQALGMDKGFKENPVQTVTTKNIKDIDTYIQGGFVERKRELIGNAVNIPNNNKNDRGILTDIKIIQTKKGIWNPKENQLKAFDRILNKLHQENIRVILVQAPINSKYYRMIQCNKEIDNYFSSKSEYYNFNELVRFDNELDFTDFDHLNQPGVKKFNEALIEISLKKQ